jgi:hypothetical protein
MVGYTVGVVGAGVGMVAHFGEPFADVLPLSHLLQKSVPLLLKYMAGHEWHLSQPWKCPASHLFFSQFSCPSKNW